MSTDVNEGKRIRGAVILGMAALFHAVRIATVGSNPPPETSVDDAEKIVTTAEQKKLVDFSA